MLGKGARHGSIREQCSLAEGRLGVSGSGQQNCRMGAEVQIQMTHVRTLTANDFRFLRQMLIQRVAGTPKRG